METDSSSRCTMICKKAINTSCITRISDEIYEVFSTRVVKHCNWDTRPDLRKLPAPQGLFLSRRSNHMTKAPFPPKLFYDPVTLKVTYIEVMGSIYFSYSNVMFCHSKFEFFSYLLQGSNLLWKHLLNLY